MTELVVPTAGAEPWDIMYLLNPLTGTSDPNADSIWFTEPAVGKIGRYKGGVFIEFKLQMTGTGGYPSAYPTGMIFDYNATSGVPYRNVWFTETGADAIGKIYYNATGDWKDRWVLSEYKVPNELIHPIDIARNPVNGLLFILSQRGKPGSMNNIGSYNPWTQQFRSYYVDTALSLDSGDALRAIAIGSDGIVWATLDYSDTSSYDKIVRLDPLTGLITTYEIPTQASDPRDLTVDIDKNVWFTEYNKDKVGRLNPITGYVTEYTLPTSGGHPLGITTRDNIVWFTEWEGNKIGRLDPTSGTVYSTVNTITSATSSSATVNTVSAATPVQTSGTVWFSTSTGHTYTYLPAAKNTATHYTTGATYTGDPGHNTITMTVSNRFATSTVTTNTETVYVLPTSTTASTTSIFTSTFWTTTTISPTLTSVISTDVSSTTITTSAIFSTPVATETTYTTRQVIETEYVTTTTQTNFAATSYRYTTLTVPTYTQYSTSTLRQTTTETVSTVTVTSTIYTTSTTSTTVTAGILGPAVLALGILLALDFMRRKGSRTNQRGGS
jgi:virginiamycin B lyase